MTFPRSKFLWKDSGTCCLWDVIPSANGGILRHHLGWHGSADPRGAPWVDFPILAGTGSNRCSQ